jgi:hypothetical protein
LLDLGAERRPIGIFVVEAGIAVGEIQARSTPSLKTVAKK